MDLTTPRPVSASQITFTRVMTLMDANALGKVHGGVVMREVDGAAGTAAARHCGRPAVTASIDELSFLEPVEIGDLLIVSARVNAVGRTSLEVGVRVEAEPWTGGRRRHTTSAYLVMVALGDDGRPSPVPPLLPESPEEHRRMAQAAIRGQIRRERIQRVTGWAPESGMAPPS